MIKIRGHYFAKLDPLEINVTNFDRDGAWLRVHQFGIQFFSLKIT